MPPWNTFCLPPNLYSPIGIWISLLLLILVNTYRVRGLPPAPICNPGRASLEAAFAPPSVPFLFFVARPDGSHHFSSFWEEHRQAQQLYGSKP
ncbi:MAG TPA: hypothetical protein ENM97_05125 [Moorella mulderi]|nr:hypothetical protein [Moorella mulderi]